VSEKSKFFFIFCFVVTFVFVMGCENAKKMDSEKSAKKVTLKIHAWEGYALEHVEAFKQHAKEKLGVDVDLKITITTGLDSFIEAIEKSDVHVISPANDLLVPLKNRNLILPLEISKIPKYRQINPNVLNKKAHEIDGVVYAIPSNFGPYGIAYNKDKVPEPKSYKIFWDPKYKKRVSISADYDTLNIYMTALMLGYTNIFNLDDKQLKLVEEKLIELCKNQISEFWGPNLNPKNYQNYDLGMDWGIGVMQINKTYGKNWGFTIPHEGVTGWIDTWAVTSNVKDPDIKLVSYEYLNFMITPKIQAKMAKLTTYAPVNPYAGRYLSITEKKMYYLADPGFINKYKLWKPLSQEILKQYQDLWRRVKIESNVNKK